MDGLVTSLVHRPYVFVFLAAYCFLAWRRWGWPRTILWLASGYAIAWLSEVSSIHNGFPYGEYHYVYENLQGELLVAGVPFFDSLSYVFLTFAGFAMGEFILSRHEAGGTRQEIPNRGRWGVSCFAPRASRLVFLGALLTMLLDVIIDPIATMGDRWFLGQIHWYAHPGWYFGVPMTNFGGWFLVSFAIIVTNVTLWKTIPTLFAMQSEIRGRRQEARRGWLYPAFYAGIALFGIAISFWVGEWKLGLASSTILVTVFAPIAFSAGSQGKNRA